MPGAYLPPVVTRLEMNIDDFVSGITKAKAALKALDGAADIVINTNIDEVAAKAAALKVELDSLKNVDINFDTNIDVTLAKLALLKAALDAINGKYANFNLNVNTASIAALLALNRGVTGFSTRLTNNIAKMNAWITASQIFGLYVDDLTVKMAKLAATSQTVSINMALMMTAMAGLIRAQTSNITSANAALIAAQAALLRAQTAAARRQNNNGGGGFGLPWGLGGSVTPWQGTALAHSTPVWHPISDIVIESFIALGAALLDLALAGAAMAPSAVEVYDRIEAIRNVAGSLGGSMGAAQDSIAKFTRSLAPNTIEAFGGALNIFTKNGSQAENVIRQVVIGLDDWIAKIDIFMNTRGNGAGILTFGLNVLHQFEGIINSLGVAFANIMKDDPGTIHYMLDLVQAAAKLLQLFTELPAPFVRTVLQIHAAWLWGGLLYNQLVKIPGVGTAISKSLQFIGGTTGISAMLKGFAQLGPAIAGDQAAMDAFQASSVTALRLAGVVALGLAIADIAINWNSASVAVSGYISKQNQSLQGMSAETAFNSIPNMIQGLNQQIANVKPPSFSQWNSLGNWGNSFAKDTKAVGQQFGDFFASFANPSPSADMFGHLGTAFKDMFSQSGGQAQQAATDAGAYRVQIQGLSKDQQQLFGTMVGVTKQGYSVQSAFGLMNLASVQASDGAALAAQKVANLVAGYKAMGIQGRLMQNSVNAVNFSTWLGDSNIANVTGGWTTFISTVTGGVTAFQTFQQGLLSLKTAAQTAGASMTGLDANSLTLQQDFSTNVTNASAMINSLYTLAAVSKQGAAGTNDITQATKDLLAQMIPAVGNNKALQYSLIALAQQGGAPAVKNMTQLAQWVGKVNQPAQQLNSIMTQMTGASSNLAQDIQNLATAMNPTMTSAMDQAIVQASGGTKALENYATSVLHGNTNSAQFAQQTQTVVSMLIAIYGKTGAAKTQFEAYNQMMGIGKSVSDQVWAAMTSNAQNSAQQQKAAMAVIQAAIDSLHGTTIPINIVTSGTIPGIGSSPVVGISSASALNKAKRTLPGLAKGTPSAAAGWSWVGEKGPELINLRGGETVIPNHVAQGYASGAGDYSGDTHVHVYLDGRKVYQAVQKQSVQSERRTGTNRMARRTR